MVLGRKYPSEDFESLEEKPASRWTPYVYTLVFLILLSVANSFLIPYVGYRATGFVFLVGVLPIAVGYGLAPALLFATLSALVWDYYFIPPQFTLNIQTSEDVMMNLTYFAVALVSGFSGSRIRKQERSLKAREKQAKLLYQIEKHLADKSSVALVIEEATSILKTVFDLESIILSGKDGTGPLSEDEIEQARWTYRNGKRAGNGTSTFSDSKYSFYPLRGNESTAGVLVVPSDITKNLKIEPVLRELGAVVGAAVEREIHREISRRNALLEESERLHQTLLDSVSHELRTPLTTILGIANQLSIYDLKSSAERLNQTVTNLLDMSRISSGALRLSQSVIDLSDFVRTCVARADYLLGKHRVKIQDPREALYVKGDEKVLETAIANLLSNAARYSPEGTEIQIAIRPLDRKVSVEITNQGTRIPSGDEEEIFDKFYSNSGGAGLGLGLAIVREIVELHLGTVSANSGDGRTTFTILLPREELPDRLKEELRTL